MSNEYVEVIDVLASFDIAIELAGEIICAFHDMEKIVGEKLRIRPCAPDTSGLADEFMERFPELDLPDDYGHRRIIVTFQSDIKIEDIHPLILWNVKTIIDKHSSAERPICFDTLLYISDVTELKN